MSKEIHYVMQKNEYITVGMREKLFSLKRGNSPMQFTIKAQ